VLILGQRLSEWCGHGPALEEDIALTNHALDYLGQATLLLKHAGETEGAGRDEDQLAFLRDAPEFRNCLIVELPVGDYAFTVARQFVFSTWYELVLERLLNSSDEFLREFAAKSIKEARYHKQHAQDWVLRLGDGTDESHSRMQKAFDEIWNYTPELFEMDELEKSAVASGVGPDLNEIRTVWSEKMKETLHTATLQMPADGWGHKGGKRGNHTEHLGYVLADMQFLQRAYPNARW
jgi:ring-1,2-phenylacetyl-CoA epoxidase subunit PaaC